MSPHCLKTRPPPLHLTLELAAKFFKEPQNQTLVFKTMVIHKFSLLFMLADSLLLSDSIVVFIISFTIW